MDDAPSLSRPVRLMLSSPDETTRLARWLGARLLPGDTVLLEGPIGAGKSHFCRGLIQSRLAATGRMEEVPSPSFTLVQTYDAGSVEIWHADLYRLAGPEGVAELGLEEAFDEAVCLVEWPDRLGEARPLGALTLRLAQGPGDEARMAELSAEAPHWAPVLAALAHGDWRADD